MESDANRSVIGRLLEEISWEGRRVRAYRQGGRGLENVLTTEVLLPLSYLPRSAFLGAVLAGATGAGEVRAQLAAEVAQAELTLLPDESRLGALGKVVQPDATILTTSCHALVEAKRIRRSAFQPEQLAREYLVVLQDAGERRPLLLLILGAPPPVRVKGLGPTPLDEAVMHHLERVHSDSGDVSAYEDAVRRIPDVIAWITWDQIRQTVIQQRDAFQNADEEIVQTVRRLCDSVTDAIDWHA